MTARRVNDERGRRPRVKLYALVSGRMLRRSGCGGLCHFAGGRIGTTSGAHCFATPRTVIPAARKQCWNVLQTFAHPDPTQLIRHLRC